MIQKFALFNGYLWMLTLTQFQPY